MPLMVHLRPATPEDAPFLYGLFAHDRAAEVRGWGLPEAMIPGLVAQQHRARSLSWAAAWPAATDHLIEVDGVRMGRLLLANAAHHLHIVDIAVAPEHRGRGLGTTVLRELQARGAPLRLSVALANPALRLYHRLGFRTDPAVSDDDVYTSLVWP